MHASRGVKRILSILREPVSAESRRKLRQKWERLPDSLRTPRQLYGWQAGGCGATIGIMPRCDFACRGCYLGADANHVPPMAIADIERQIDRLREQLGDGGNLQLTDGEVTLRPIEDLIHLIKYARAKGLIPMLMTHGDSFRRNPQLLPRLVAEAGLSEISIHVDTTQRGRRGVYKRVESEIDLMPLRDEFASIVRETRRATGRRLRCAMTMTVTQANLTGVTDVARWAMRNADAVHLLSFQPVALVGRTEPRIAEPVSVDDLWLRIACGLFGDDESAAAMRAEFLGAHVHVGHPACNRVVPGMVVRSERNDGRYVPIRSEYEIGGQRVIEGFLARFGGISFRRDNRAEGAARLLAIVARDPAFFARGIAAYGLPLARRAAPDGILKLAWALARGRARFDSLLLVSHHFMSGAEMRTPLGRERLANCVFHVPHGNDLIPMCAMNAAGGREEIYQALRRQHPH